MTISRMSAEDALALFDAPEPCDPADSIGTVADPVDAPLAGYVAYHPEHGAFLGIVDGAIVGHPGARIALWSNMECGGHESAALFDSPETGRPFFVETGAARPEMLDDIEYFATPSGHWRDLQALGLNTHDMPFSGYYPSNQVLMH